MHDIKSSWHRFKTWNLFLILSIFTITPSTSQDIPNKALDSLYQLAYTKLGADDYYAALKTISKLQEIATEKNLDNYKADANHLLGLAYLQHYNYDKAEIHFFEAMTSNKERNDSLGQAINYANIMHLYVLAKDYDKYDAHIAQAKALDKKVNDHNRFYYYETELMRLYDLKKYDSLVYVSKQALYKIKNSPYSTNYTNKKKIESIKYRLEITYKLFLVYGLMEQNTEKDYAYKLLNTLEKVNLEAVLWYSARVFEHISKVRQYKELYHLRQNHIIKDSVLYYKNAAAQYAETAQILLKEKSAKNNKYLIHSISKDEELKRSQIAIENQAIENTLIKKIIYLFIAISIITFLFGIYFYSSSKKLNQTNRNLKKLQVDSNKFLNVVSHEIKTPLYNLQELMTKVLRERKAENQEDMGHINHSIINLRHAIDNSLQFSRFNYFALNRNVHNRPVNLVELLKKIQPYFSDILELHPCDIEIRHALKNEEFLVNETKLNIILRNILKNALEAPHVTKIIFEIEEHVITNDTSEIVFSIQDNGNGIPEKTLTDIEEKIILLPNENHHKGIRLGLILCNQILSLYDSKLSFQKTNHIHKVSFPIILQSIASDTQNHQNQFLQNTDWSRIFFNDNPIKNYEYLLLFLVEKGKKK
ncbi:MAG: hypothetical protein HRT67_12035 [Flavobacteriaceae bacterium]|nr:hypothetical protein [Flavobacteriaceae bacterium]